MDIFSRLLYSAEFQKDLVAGGLGKGEQKWEIDVLSYSTRPCHIYSMTLL